jgi:hypothetical protein
MRHWERGFLWIALQMRLKADLSRTCFEHRLTLIYQETPAYGSKTNLNHYIRTWRISKDQQGCHHLQSTSTNPWDIGQTKDNP